MVRPGLATCWFTGPTVLDACAPIATALSSTVKFPTVLDAESAFQICVERFRPVLWPRRKQGHLKMIRHNQDCARQRGESQVASDDHENNDLNAPAELGAILLTRIKGRSV